MDEMLNNEESSTRREIVTPGIPGRGKQHNVRKQLEKVLKVIEVGLELYVRAQQIELFNKDVDEPVAAILIPGIFISIVCLMVAISVILSIVQSVNGSSYNILLGTALVGLLVVQLVMIILARTGGISRQKTWFVYVVGLCIFIESILTNVVMFG